MRKNDQVVGGESRLDRRDLLVKGGAMAAVATAAGTAIAAGASPAVAAPLAPVLMPFGPERIYDSRDGDGPIHGGWVVTLTSDSPATDAAYLLNLTITNTLGAGYLSVFSADIVWPGSSTINWYGAGQINANSAYTAIRQSDQGIKVQAGGGGSTEFIIDVTGVLTLVDLAGVNALAGTATRAPGGGVAPLTLTRRERA